MLVLKGTWDKFKARNTCVSTVSYMDHGTLESFEEFLIKPLRFKCAVVCFNCFKYRLKQFCSCGVLIGIVWNKTVSCMFLSAPCLLAHSFCPMCYINHQYANSMSKIQDDFNRIPDCKVCLPSSQIGLVESPIFEHVRLQCSSLFYGKYQSLEQVSNILSAAAVFASSSFPPINFVLHRLYECWGAQFSLTFFTS